MSRKTGRPSYAIQAAGARRGTVTWPAFAIAVSVAAIVAGLVGFIIGQPSATDQSVSDLRAEEARRDLVQIQELTSVARQSQATLNGLLVALNKAFAASEPPSAATVAEWQTTIATIVERHADTPSGTTGTNVARGGFRSSVNGFAEAIDLLATARTLPPAARANVVTLAKRITTTAATVWSVAAAQVDQLNVDAGYGHQHVYLETADGSGAFTSDGSPEGHGS